MLLFLLILTAVISYLFGSLPTGYLLAKRAGVDLRREGSKSTGATNTLRVLGKKAGLVVLLVDILKGSLALLTSYFLAKLFLEVTNCSLNKLEILNLGCSLLELKGLIFLVSSISVLWGHSKSIWINFRGGKSVASGAGVLLVINWKVALFCFFTWLIVIYFFRVSSLAAIITIILLPVYMYLFEFFFPNKDHLGFCQKLNSYFYLGISLFSGLFIICKHKENIKRLIKKQEPKINS